MTTCVVVNTFTMGVNPRQSYHEQDGRAVNISGELMDLKQGADNSFWCSAPTRSQPSVAERISRSALRALLQQPPPLSLVPDAHLGSETLDNDRVMQPQYQYQGRFQNSNLGLSPSIHSPPQYSNSLQPSQHQQVRHQGFDVQQQPASHHYHGHYSSNHSGGQHELHAGGSLSLSRGQSDQLGQLYQRRMLQRELEGVSRHDLPGVLPGMGMSLPKDLEKMHAMATVQQQMHKIRLERKRSFDQDRQLSSPDCARGSKLKFGITADGIRNGPDTHPVLHGQQQQQQRQQLQQLFPAGFVSTNIQANERDLNVRGAPVGSSVPTETKMQVKDEEAAVLKQFQERVFQLDAGTRLNLKESLFRLARSARERQEETRTSNPASPEPDFHAAVMEMMDLDTCSDRSASVLRSRVKDEKQTNPADRTLMTMMFCPLSLPGLQNSSEPLPASWTRHSAASGAASKTPGNWNCSTSVGPQNNNNWECAPGHGDPSDSASMAHVQFHVRNTSGAALEAPTSRTVSSLTGWSTDSPQLTDYSSPGDSSSPVDPSMLDPRQAEINLTYRGSPGAVARIAARHLGGGNRSTTTEPVDIIRAPRRCDSQSSIASDQSYSSSHGGQALQHFGNVGFQGPSPGPSSNNSQEAGNFASEGQHMEFAAAAGSQAAVDQQHLASQNFARMNMSIQSRTAADHIDRFHLSPPQSASYNANAKNVTVGFSPLRYEDDSHVDNEARGRNVGCIGSSTGMNIFDQKSTGAFKNMVDTGPYIRRSGLFPS